MKSLDVAFKIVAMTASALAVATFFFHFQTRESADKTYETLRQELRDVDTRRKDGDSEVKQWLVRIDNKLERVLQRR